VPLKHSRLKLDAASDYLNWYNSGWQGAFIAGKATTARFREARKFLDLRMGYWYEGKPREGYPRSVRPLMEKAGNVRDGGALWQRMAMCGLELPDGRAALSDQALERVHRRMTLAAGIGKAPRRACPSAQVRAALAGALVSCCSRAAGDRAAVHVRRPLVFVVV